VRSKVGIDGSILKQVKQFNYLGCKLSLDGEPEFDQKKGSKAYAALLESSGKDGNASIPGQVKRPNPWRKMITMIMRVSILAFRIRHANRIISALCYIVTCGPVYIYNNFPNFLNMHDFLK
jgi:hypothetical protein